MRRIVASAARLACRQRDRPAGRHPGRLSGTGGSSQRSGIANPEIIGSGGGETRFTQRLRRALAQRNWRKHYFEIATTVDRVPRESTSHELDHVKHFSAGVIACESE